MGLQWWDAMVCEVEADEEEGQSKGEKDEQDCGGDDESKHDEGVEGGVVGGGVAGSPRVTLWQSNYLPGIAKASYGIAVNTSLTTTINIESNAARKKKLLSTAPSSLPFAP
ncbi:hypothetical protein GOP47_0026206 [Adiantum capillus-veneris]|nr:hypothetical protein GOP47_0026206 [Adiantum capillus-veneris]